MAPTGAVKNIAADRIARRFARLRSPAAHLTARSLLLQVEESFCAQVQQQMLAACPLQPGLALRLSLIHI